MRDRTAATVRFCEDAVLGYRRSLTDFSVPLTLDESYRLAHLPLVAPDHPRVIARLDGKSYEMGRHPRIWSAVLPVDDAALRKSAAFLALETELRAAPFAGKIAWDILPRRADRLHATICGSLSTGAPPVLDSAARSIRMAPPWMELRGLFSGNVNRGRLYLKLYPERTVEGANACQAMQASFGRGPGDLYLVGLYNLTDDLDAAETAELAGIVARWWDRPLLRFQATHLVVMGGCDDLVLDMQLADTIPIGSGAPG